MLKPNKEDYKVIFFYIGKVLTGLGMVMVLPLLVSLLLGEWNAFLDFTIGISAILTAGFLLMLLCQTKRDPQWSHGMCIAALGWLACTLFAAVPHYLSGHFGSYLDACFDVMSGFTTTGLCMIQDIDHISAGLNIYRHILTFIGGQGMFTIVLTFFISGVSGAYKMYVGEGKDVRLFPNTLETVRAIWAISLVYLGIGTAFLWAAGLYEGLRFWPSLFHAFCMFCSTWSTGGFAPMSQNLLYYHSPLYEFICVIIMIIGSFNFVLHANIWKGKWSEAYRDIEIRSFTITSLFSFILVCAGLLSIKAYPDLLSVYRFASSLVFSAHTTTGTMSVYARQLITHWGAVASIGLTVAMAIGGSASSTAGGFKGLRMGILAKGLWQDIKKLVYPESAVVIQRFRYDGRDNILEDAHFRSAAGIVLLYVFIYAAGTIAGVLCGYPVLDAMFDSVSAGSNSGLSCGVTAYTMPTVLKIVYFLEMFVGRLEFNAVLVLIGFIGTSWFGEGVRRNGKVR